MPSRPAVPAEATARVRRLAAAEGWDLLVTGTGEFDDPRYRDNPANRCYFCKTNLYDRIAGLTERPIASGANLDDLGDYRPGLIAAAERKVVHPMVEAGMTKRDVRALARSLGLTDIAEIAGAALPRQPGRDRHRHRCRRPRLRREGGDPARRASRPRGTLRCRITHEGVVVELGEAEMAHAEAVEAIARAALH